MLPDVTTTTWCCCGYHIKSSVLHAAQMLKAEHSAGREQVAEARADKLAAAKKVADAMSERDLARQMLKGVQAMLGHAEAARSSAQRALQQAQAEKASSQVQAAASNKPTAHMLPCAQTSGLHSGPLLEASFPSNGECPVLNH